MLFNDMIKKYKPIRIFCPDYGYGWWWKDHFYFITPGTAFAIVPMWKYCDSTEYVFANGGIKIGRGDTRSWSESRQKDLSGLKQIFE